MPGMQLESARGTKYSPSNNDLLRVDLVVQIVHCAVVLHVDGDLLVRLAVQYCERGPDFDLGLVTRPKEGTDDALLRVISAQVVVEDGEEGDGVDRHFRWRAPRCSDDRS